MDIVQKLGMTQTEYENYLFEEWLDRVRPSGDNDSVQRQWAQSLDYQEMCNDLTNEAADTIQVLRANLALNQAQGEIVQYLKKILANTLMDAYNYYEGVTNAIVDALVQYRDIK